MARIRRIMIVVGVVFAVTAAPPAPASAGPAEDAVCLVTTELARYNWGFYPICL